MRRCEIERPAGTVESSREKIGVVRTTMATRGGNISGCMDDKGKFTLRKGKSLHVPLQKGDGGMIGEMRAGVPKLCRFPRKYRRPGVQPEAVVSRQKAFQHPTSKETGSPCNEELLVTEAFPMAFCRITDHFQVVLG
jgi:hypothetical protein